MSTDQVSSIWEHYLFGLGQHERLKEIGQDSNIEFLENGYYSLATAIKSGAEPMQLAQIFFEKGHKWSQLFAEFSYLWLTETASASRASNTHTWPVFATLVSETLQLDTVRRRGLCIGDYGCGPGVQLDQIARIVLNALTRDTPVTILQEENNPLAAFAAAVRALEVGANYPNLTIMTFHNDIRNEPVKSKEYPAPQIGLALASTLPYFVLEDQKVFLKRMMANKTSKLLFSGQVNGFNPYRYFLTGYEGKLFQGLRAEWRFLSGGQFPPQKAALRYAGVASKLAKVAGPVYPDLQAALDLYRDCGWNPKLERIWIPTTGEIAHLSFAKGVIISLRQSTDNRFTAS